MDGRRAERRVGPVATGVVGALREQGDPQRVLARPLAGDARRLPCPRQRRRRSAGIASSASATFAGLRPPASVIGTSRATAAASSTSTRVPVPPGCGPPAGVEQDAASRRRRGTRARRRSTASGRAPAETRSAFHVGRPVAATADGGSSPLSCTTSGSSASTISASRSAGRFAVTRTTCGRGRGGRRRPGEARERDPLLQPQLARRAGREVEAHGTGAGADGGEDAGLVGDAADLHVRQPGELGGLRAGARPAATNARAAAAGSGERMSASPTSAASNPVARQRATVPVSRTPDSATAIRSPGTSSCSRTARSGSTSSVRRSRLLMPTIRAPDASGGLELAGVVRLDERLQAEVPRLRDEPRQALRRVEDGEQQHEVGPGSPEEVELPGIDDELLGEHRDRRPRRGRPAGRPRSRRTSAARTGRRWPRRHPRHRRGPARRRRRPRRSRPPTGSGA